MSFFIRSKAMAVMVVLICFPQSRVLNAAEPSQAERQGEAKIDLSLFLDSPACISEKIDLMVSYSNKTTRVLTLHGAYMLGERRPGLIVIISNMSGQIVSLSHDTSGSLGVERVGPHASICGIVSLPKEMTPNLAGKYILTIQYQYGEGVEGKGYIHDMEVNAKPLDFYVYPKSTNIQSYAEDKFNEWKALVINSSERARQKLFHAARRDLVSRRFIVRIVTDQNMPTAIKIAAAQMLDGHEFDYEPKLIKLIEADNVGMDFKIALIKILPGMKQKWWTAPHTVLRKLWAGADKNKDLRYRLAVLNALFRAGALSPTELRAEVEKQDDPNMKLFAATLLLRTDFKDARILSNQLLTNQTLINVKALEPFGEVDSRLEGWHISQVATNYLKSIVMFEKKSIPAGQGKP